MVQHDSQGDTVDGSPSQTPTARNISIPKNRSARQLAHPEALDRSRLRFSLDAARTLEYESIMRSSLANEHDHSHGLGMSGLRRIRHQPSPRVGSQSAVFDEETIAAALQGKQGKPVMSQPPSRLPSISASVSPTVTIGEDLSRFPSESLHSFSFAHQSEELIHRRQSLLKRSIDFMRDKLGWAAANPGLAAAQAKVSGDAELQNMMELLAKANLVPGEVAQSSGLGLDMPTGPPSGPAGLDTANIFEKTLQRCDSPEPIEKEDKLQDKSLLKKVLHDQASAEASPEISSSQDTAPTESEGSHSESSTTTSLTSAPSAGRPAPVKRSLTDLQTMSLKTKLMEALAQPYHIADRMAMDRGNHSRTGSILLPGSVSLPSIHTRFAPAAQAIFTTEAKAPWTILAANDLACLVFGVTQSEVRKIGIMEVVREERREWLAEKLNAAGSYNEEKNHSLTTSTFKSSPNLAQMGTAAAARNGGSRRSRTGETNTSADGKLSGQHSRGRSRGVLLCGDVVPIQKRNGLTGAASLWVKEKRTGLIWVLEEINENSVSLEVDNDGKVTKATGDVESIWGRVQPKADISSLFPHIPREGDRSGPVDWQAVRETPQYAACNFDKMCLPCSVDVVPGVGCRVSSFPHIAGIIVVSAYDMTIRSSNSVFSSALFGQSQPDGLHISELIPDLDRLLQILTEEDQIELVDGLVLPEHSFRRAWAMLALREGKSDISSFLLKPCGLTARHRDGSELQVDMQMRVVKNECAWEEAVSDSDSFTQSTELLYALWVTYSRNLHSAVPAPDSKAEEEQREQMHQPSPGQTVSDVTDSIARAKTPVSSLSQEIKADALGVPTGLDGTVGVVVPTDAVPKKTIADFMILEDMGQGAYGQVKLARYKKNGQRKVVLKYVTKRRILVDTWTRDRKLGTVPLEIHVLNYLRSEDLKHVNIVEMADFFEDDTNYYIEMVPHGLPGMDLFDYIELRVNMEEDECRNIFRQVASAVEHLHNKALVVHRDIKDENVILDGEGNVKLIDFGSAAYIKSGPFDVFVGTIDYAAPEVLAGKQYRGPEQDIWALGVLLYTIIYKENPFYNIDEIMDRDLRTPYIMSEDSIDIVRQMLDRDLEKRIVIADVVKHPWISNTSS